MNQTLTLKCLTLKIFALVSVSIISQGVRAFETNEARFLNPPTWLKRTRAQGVIDRTQSRLEWTIRKINVRYFDSESEYLDSHTLGRGTLAVTTNSRQGSSVLLSPRVTANNFDSVFAHELVHVILYQKYKDAVPKWLEEGLANHIARVGKVDYKWLSRQPPIGSVKELSHPMQVANQSMSEKEAKEWIHSRYQASQAIAEMLERKCGLENLVRLSVGKGLEKYLETLCQITDLELELKKWIESRARTA